MALGIRSQFRTNHRHRNHVFYLWGHRKRISQRHFVRRCWKIQTQRRTSRSAKSLPNGSTRRARKQSSHSSLQSDSCPVVLNNQTQESCTVFLALGDPMQFRRPLPAGKACAKMLVRAKYRCECHFLLSSQCPSKSINFCTDSALGRMCKQSHPTSATSQSLLSFLPLSCKFTIAAFCDLCVLGLRKFLSHVVICVSVFCGDGKGGAPNFTQLVPAPAATPAPAQLALPAAAQAVPPPRPRPTVAPPRFPTRSPSRQSKRSLRRQRSRTPSRAGSRARLTSNVPPPVEGPPAQWQDLSPPQPAQPAQPVQPAQPIPPVRAQAPHQQVPHWPTWPRPYPHPPLPPPGWFHPPFHPVPNYGPPMGPGMQAPFSAPAPASFSAPESRPRAASKEADPETFASQLIR